MISATELATRQAEARARLAAIETLIQFQVNHQSMFSSAADLAADGTLAAASTLATGALTFGSWLGSTARWAWEHTPGHDEIEAIARDAWARATRELSARSAEFRAVAAQIHAIERDPAGFVQNVYNTYSRWSANRNATDPHCESPRGTIKFDGAFWENSRSLPQELIYKAPAAKIAAHTAAATVGPGGAHASDPELTFLYLDVGRWGGVPGADCRRDFGIVAGRTAAVCEFGPGIHGGGVGATIPASRTDIPAADRVAINKVLAVLGAGGGSVMVVRAMASRTVVPDSAVVPSTVYIYLGDMHLPVLTGLDASPPPAVQMGRFEIDDAAFRFGLKGTLAVNNAVVDRAKSYARSRLPSWAPDMAGDIIDGTIERLRMSQTGYMGTIGTFDRALWLSAYGRADIFKEASADLGLFVTRLEAYRSAAATADPPVHLLQLGDMFDLWIGMLCFFLRVPETSPASHFQLDGTWMAPTSPEYVNYWIESTLWNTSHSGGVARFLSYSGDRTFLYGNHDNYLSQRSVTPPSLSAYGGYRHADTTVANLFFAEHGHRPDSFNKDGAILGWLITQSAFRQPAVRSVEPSSRYAQVIAAGNHWLDQGATHKYCHYVMGHTHQAGLARVTIETL